ncbi:MAG TPA: response regulator [Anaerolineales bacterium]
MPTILIIDDEPALLLGLAAKIRRHGYTVVTATDGSDGFQKAKESIPDLIISDIMMPPPNGFELRRLLSLEPELASISFIFLTARSSAEDRIGGLRDGADDYITKPFETEELFARIEAVFRRVETERARGREEMRAVAQNDMEKLKQEILQNFQHELCTPLTNILLPLELATDHRFEDPEEQSRFLRIALSNADRLESLVTDMILLSNIDQGNLNSIRQNVDLQTHLIVPVRRRLDRYQQKNLNLVLDCPEQGTILAPRREFTQAVIHIIDNAFKFSPENGNVRLNISLGNQGGATLLVQDEGPGIPVKLREKVFERFYQISQGDSREKDGLGVGLTIARAIFRNFGGSVEIIDSSMGCAVRAWLPDCNHDDIVYG